jgi:hypothetical protein
MYQIGRITPTGSVMVFSLPTAGSSLLLSDITNGPDGAIWFTETVPLSGTPSATSTGTPTGTPTTPVESRIGRITL